MVPDPSALADGRVVALTAEGLLVDRAVLKVIN